MCEAILELSKNGLVLSLEHLLLEDETVKQLSKLLLKANNFLIKKCFNTVFHSGRQIPYDLTYKWNLINKTNKQSSKIEPETVKLRTY